MSEKSKFYLDGLSLRTIAQRIILLMRKHWSWKSGNNPIDVADKAMEMVSASPEEEKIIYRLINKGLENGGEIKWNQKL